MTREELGGRLKTLREDLDVTQQDLAERTGLHQVEISKLERGERGVSIDKLLQYMNGLSFELLFQHTGNRKHV